MGWRKEDCNCCSGTGRIVESTSRRCPKCSGKGWRSGIIRDIITCWYCGGNGCVEEEERHDCRSCEGRGWFATTDDPPPQQHNYHYGRG